MSMATANDYSQVKVLWLEEFPAFSYVGSQSSTLQIAAFLKKLMQTQKNCSALVLPSVIALSGFFQRSELDILDALMMLNGNGLEHRFVGLDGVITLWTKRVNQKVSWFQAFREKLSRRQKTGKDFNPEWAGSYS